LVQVHLAEGRVSATSVPVLPAAPAPVRVAVSGRGLGLDRSARWTWTSPDDPDLDVLVVETDDVAQVRRLVRERAGVAVVVVLSAAAPSATLVDALAVGADACVRGSGKAELGAHLAAVARRRTARWARPAAVATSSPTSPSSTPKDQR
jgi:DNA-binding response OmpR family regulator